MKALAIVITAFALTLAPASWAQQPDTPKTETPAQAQEAEQSLTGCLSAQESTFLLRTSSGEIKLEGSGLEAHVGKMIRVIGTSSDNNGERTFTVSDVTVVSPQCQT